MADKMRWRYADTNPVVAAVDSATVIEIGDLLWQDTDDVKPASVPAREAVDIVAEIIHHVVPTVNLQELFADKFLGVAMQRSRNGDTAPIRVATTGVFEFDVLGGDCFELGDLVAISRFPDGLQNQQVAKTQLSMYAIGRVAKRAATPVISVLVDIRSRVMGIPA